MRLGRAYSIEDPLAFPISPCPSCLGLGDREATHPSSFKLLAALRASKSWRQPTSQIPFLLSLEKQRPWSGAEAQAFEGARLGLQSFYTPGTHKFNFRGWLGKGTGKVGMTVPGVQMRKLSPGRNHDWPRTAGDSQAKRKRKPRAPCSPGPEALATLFRLASLCLSLHVRERSGHPG